MAKQEPALLVSDSQKTKRKTKFRISFLLLVATFISFASFVSAYDREYEQNDSFREGYSAGYEHGYADQQSRTNFDFRNDREYQREDNYNVSRQDLNSRLGYVEGYADGYFRKNPLVELNQQTWPRGRFDQNYGSHRSGITVFTDTGYRGYSREFGLGQYPSIDGRLDDDIQSIRVNGNLRVVLFEDNKFRGKRIVIERDVTDLGDFRDKAGSMIIESIRYGQTR